MSATYTTAHVNPGSLTHWVRPGNEPESSWMLLGFISTVPQQELPIKPFVFVGLQFSSNVEKIQLFFSSKSFSVPPSFLITLMQSILTSSNRWLMLIYFFPAFFLSVPNMDFFFFFFLAALVGCKVPRPGIELAPQQWPEPSDNARSLPHWASRELLIWIISNAMGSSHPIISFAMSNLLLSHPAYFLVHICTFPFCMVLGSFGIPFYPHCIHVLLYIFEHLIRFIF